VWNIKGRFKTAIEDDEDAMWISHDGEDILRILVVSIEPIEIERINSKNKIK